MCDFHFCLQALCLHVYIKRVGLQWLTLTATLCALQTTAATSTVGQSMATASGAMKAVGAAADPQKMVEAMQKFSRCTLPVASTAARTRMPSRCLLLQGTLPSACFSVRGLPEGRLSGSAHALALSHAELPLPMLVHMEQCIKMQLHSDLLSMALAGKTPRWIWRAR